MTWTPSPLPQHLWETPKSRPWGVYGAPAAARDPLAQALDEVRAELPRPTSEQELRHLAGICRRFNLDPWWLDKEERAKVAESWPLVVACERREQREHYKLLRERAEAARKARIQELLGHVLKVDSKLEDGAYEGVRAWIWDSKRRLLLSPIQGTAWGSPLLRAPSYEVNEVIRGRAGIHAAWPCVTPPPALWPHELRDSVYGAGQRVVLGRVAAYGTQIVKGEMGWRAEACMMVELFVRRSKKVASEIHSVYKDVPVHSVSGFSYAEKLDLPLL